MKILLNLLSSCAENLRSISLFKDQGGLKSSRQFEEHHKTVSKYFTFKIKDSLTESWNYDIFLILDGKNLVAHSKVVKGEYHYVDKNKKRRSGPFVSIYCILVTDQYKGRKLSYEIVKYTVNSLIKHYSLNKSTILALHLSPADEFMPVALKIYYQMGFRKGAFCDYGPEEYKNRLQYLFDIAKDPYDVCKDFSLSETKGSYFCLYCPIKDFNKYLAAPKDAIEQGKTLKKELMRRLKAIEDKTEL